MLDDSNIPTIRNDAQEQTLLSHVLNLNVEKDKQLLTLSAGGLALLGTLLAAKGTSGFSEMFLCVLGIICFTIAIGSMLWAFRKHESLAAASLNNAPDSEKVILATRRLRLFQGFGTWSFYIGAALSALFAVFTANATYEKAQTEKNISQYKSMISSTNSSLEEMNKTMKTIRDQVKNLQSRVDELHSHKEPSKGDKDAD